MDSKPNGVWNVGTPAKEGEYVCYTNYEDVFNIRFRNGDWERPARFNPGEAVLYWTEQPK